MKGEVKVFLDTSVLVAASQAQDPRHASSHALLAAATPHTTACGAHTLAEVYAVLSRLPGGRKQRPDVAVLLVEQIVARMRVIALTAEEYATAIRQTGQAGLSGGIVFDALLLACARKVQAERIYTWNEKHFRLVATDLAERIVTP